MIRRAMLRDMPHIMAILERAYQEMDYQAAGYSFDYESAYRVVVGNLDTTFVDPDGVASYMIVPSIMNCNEWRAVEYIWHSDPLVKDKAKRLRIMIRLLLEMEHDAKRRGLKTLTMSASSEHTATHRLLGKMGYRITEVSAVKEV